MEELKFNETCFNNESSLKPIVVKRDVFRKVVSEGNLDMISNSYDKKISKEYEDIYVDYNFSNFERNELNQKSLFLNDSLENFCTDKPKNILEFFQLVNFSLKSKIEHLLPNNICKLSGISKEEFSIVRTVESNFQITRKIEDKPREVIKLLSNKRKNSTNEIESQTTKMNYLSILTKKINSNIENSNSIIKAYQSKLKQKNWNSYIENSRINEEKNMLKVYHKCNFPNC